jgi:hypothetical protein
MGWFCCPSEVGTETTDVSEGTFPETAGASVLPQADNTRVKISANVMQNIFFMFSSPYIIK